MLQEYNLSRTNQYSILNTLLFLLRRESLMLEITASTITVHSQYYGTFYCGATTAEMFGGVYVTASMWACNDNSCVGDAAFEITAEPAQMIPLHVRTTENEEIAGDDWYPQYSEGAYNDTLTMTNTAKLFFPDSKLEKGTYYVTLDFYVEVSVSIAQSYSWVGAWSGAALGPHIVEAEIITDGDFGNCGWLDPAAGAGFFDGGGKG